MPPNLPKMSYISSVVMLNGRLRTYRHLRCAWLLSGALPVRASMVWQGWAELGKLQGPSTQPHAGPA